MSDFSEAQRVLSWAVPEGVRFPVGPFWDEIGEWRGEAAFVYWSPLRPLVRPPPGADSYRNAKHQSIAFAMGPLANQIVYDFSLIPLWHAVGSFLWQLAQENGGKLELANKPPPFDDDVQVKLLFKNPRGIWQLSHFEAVGPTGHVEGEPELLLYEAYTAKFRVLAEGLVDALSESFQGIESAPDPVSNIVVHEGRGLPESKE